MIYASKLRRFSSSQLTKNSELSVGSLSRSRTRRFMQVADILISRNKVIQLRRYTSSPKLRRCRVIFELHLSLSRREKKQGHNVAAAVAALLTGKGAAAAVRGARIDKSPGGATAVLMQYKSRFLHHSLRASCSIANPTALKAACKRCPNGHRLMSSPWHIRP